MNLIFFIVEASHQEIHSDHKIVRRELNQINQEIKPIKPEVLKADHQHSADEAKKLNVKSEPKHSDTTHSAIGI